jgi:hypothetical protein
VARDETNDLAVISFSSSNPSIPTAVPIRDTSVRLGEAAIVMGYPLADRLSATHPGISVGYVSAVVGPHDDTRYLQTTAPVQPGNSGGPLLDAGGHLIGIVVSKLAPESPQDRPENIGFAVKGAVVRAFLDANHIAYVTARSDKQLSPDEVAAIAQPATVYIECSLTVPPPATVSQPRYEPAPAVSADPPPQRFVPPQPAAPPPMRTLPACDAVNSELTSLGNQKGVYVYRISPFTLTNTGDANLCGAYAWTSAGKLAVSYTITWTDRRAGTYWVQLPSYRRTW